MKWIKCSKTLLVVIAIAVVAPINAACSAKVVEIGFWNGLTGPDGKTMDELIKRFGAEYPNIKVKQQRLDWDKLFEKLVVSLAAGKAPETFIVHPSEFFWFLKAKAMRPLDAFANGPKGIPKADRVQSIWKVAESDGKLVGIPLDSHNAGLFYNKDMFAQAGLDPEHPPETGDEFVTAGKKLTQHNPNGRITRLGFSYLWSDRSFITMLKQFGGSLLNEARNKATFDSEQGIHALQALADFNTKYHFAETGGLGPFINQKAAMGWEGPFVINELAKVKFNWAPAEMPLFGSQKGTWTSGHVLHITPSTSGTKLEASWTLVKWLSDHSLDWAKGGQIPVRPSALNSKEFKAMTTQYTFSRMLPYATFEPSLRKMTDFRNTWIPAIDAVLQGKDEPRRALSNAVRNANKILSTMK